MDRQVFYLGIYRQAVVAHVALVIFVLLSKISQQWFTATFVSLHKLEHIFEVFFSNFFFAPFFLVDEILNLLFVRAVVEHHTVGAQSIAASPANLLIIGFNIFGQIIVHHKTYIGLVDAHTKSDGGDNNLNIIADKSLLIAIAHALRKTSVIGFYGVALFFELNVEFLNLFARKAVNNARLLFAGIQKVEGLFERIILFSNAQKQVWAVEAGKKGFGILELEDIFYIFANPRRGCGG